MSNTILLPLYDDATNEHRLRATHKQTEPLQQNKTRYLHTYTIDSKILMIVIITWRAASGGKIWNFKTSFNTAGLVKTSPYFCWAASKALSVGIRIVPVNPGWDKSFVKSGWVCFAASKNLFPSSDAMSSWGETQHEHRELRARLRCSTEVYVNLQDQEY